MSIPLLALGILVGLAAALWGETPIALTPTAGTLIDRQERQRYHLFPDIAHFESAQIFQVGPRRFRVDYTYWSGTQLKQGSSSVAPESLEETRLHLALSDRFFQQHEPARTHPLPRPATIYWLGLRYGAATRYELADQLLKDLAADYPNSAWADSASQLGKDIHRLRTSTKALFLPGSLLDQRGRIDLLVFGGYYGLWHGLATPLAFEADASPAYAAGLLLGPPLGFWLAHRFTKQRPISPSRATLIKLGAHLGTWQGLGWGGVADLKANGIIASGQIAGLAGLTASTLLSRRWQPSQGHIGLTNAAMYWGAWAGLVTALIADHKNDALWRDMLLGSDALVLVAALSAAKVEMDNQRIRLVNLAGVLGAAFGLGLDLLFQVDNKAAVGLTTGAGSLVGLAAGMRLTRPHQPAPSHTLIPRPNLVLLAAQGRPAPGGGLTWMF